MTITIESDLDMGKKNHNVIYYLGQAPFRCKVTDHTDRQTDTAERSFYGSTKVTGKIDKEHSFTFRPIMVVMYTAQNRCVVVITSIRRRLIHYSSLTAAH